MTDLKFKFRLSGFRTPPPHLDTLSVSLTKALKKPLGQFKAHLIRVFVGTQDALFQLIAYGVLFYICISLLLKILAALPAESKVQSGSNR